MTKEQFTKSIIFSVYKVIRIQNPPSVENFLKMKNSELLDILSDSSPTGWDTFWQEILARQVSKDLRAEYRIVIDHFDYTWFNEKDKTLQDLINFAWKPGNIITLP